MDADFKMDIKTILYLIEHASFIKEAIWLQTEEICP